MPQRPARDFRNDDTCRRRERGHYEAGLVADTAGGMLIHLRAGNRREIYGLAGPHNAICQGADFTVSHPGEIHGHQKSRNLVVRYRAGSVRFHQVRNLFGSQFSAIALLVDQVDCSHEK